MEDVFFDTSLSNLEAHTVEFDKRSFQFLVKRDDLIDDLVSGNKWRKLRLYIEQARQKGATGILTFGGAFSNHLIATAKACRILGLSATGIVRGDELNADSNGTLKLCAELGMELVFVDRETYRDRNNWDYLTALKHGFPGFQIVPEGGAGFYGMLGCQDILKEIDKPMEHIFLAAGTGTTAAGILLEAKAGSTVHIVSSLKGGFMKGEVEKQLLNVATDEEMMAHFMDKAQFHDDFHFGGYGKSSLELEHFQNSFEQQTLIPLDTVYTAKAAFAMIAWMSANEVDGNVLFIHTGGRGLTLY